MEFAGDALMEMAVAEIGDVIGDHSADDREFAVQFPFEHVDIADAVLQADDGRAGAPERRNFLGCFRGRAAFDAQGDDVGVGQCLAVGSKIDSIGRQGCLPAAVVAQRKAIFGNFACQAGAADEADIQSCRLPAAADKTAD